MATVCLHFLFGPTWEEGRAEKNFVIISCTSSDL